MAEHDHSAHDFGIHLRQIAKSPLTLVLLALLAVVHVVSLAAIDDLHGFHLAVGLSREGMKALAWWQMPAYAWLHGGWAHLAMNGVLLLVVGSRLEQVIGSWGMLKVLMLGVLCGGLLHLALSRSVVIGASGGVLALLLCYTTLSSESVLLVPLRMSARNLGRGLLIASVVLTLLDPEHGAPLFARAGRAISDIGLESLFRISHACHLGGALAGWCCARWILRPRVSLSRLQRDRARREGRAGH